MKQVCRLNCTQSREQEELLATKEDRIAALEAEIGQLRAGGSRSGDGSRSEGSSLTLPELITAPPRHVRRLKVPPVEPFTGEDPAVKLDDWLLILTRASLWNCWSPEEWLLQFAGHLRGCGLQEWDLLSDRDRATFDAAVGVLRERLDPGGKVQDFRHCFLSESESVSDFIFYQKAGESVLSCVWTRQDID